MGSNPAGITESAIHQRFSGFFVLLHPCYSGKEIIDFSLFFRLVFAFFDSVFLVDFADIRGHFTKKIIFLSFFSAVIGYIYTILFAKKLFLYLHRIAKTPSQYYEIRGDKGCFIWTTIKIFITYG